MTNCFWKSPQEEAAYYQCEISLLTRALRGELSRWEKRYFEKRWSTQEMIKRLVYFRMKAKEVKTNETL